MIRAASFSPLLLLALAPALPAQTSAGWDSVKQLTAGKEIRVAMTNGRSLQGEFQSATDDSLLVAASKSPETLNRALIAKVSSKGKSHRLRNALIGLGAGAGAGLTAGAIADRECRNCLIGKDLGKELFTPVGALIGLVVGALFPTGGWREIYRVK